MAKFKVGDKVRYITGANRTLTITKVNEYGYAYDGILDSDGRPSSGFQVFNMFEPFFELVQEEPKTKFKIGDKFHSAMSGVTWTVTGFEDGWYFWSTDGSMCRHGSSPIHIIDAFYDHYVEPKKTREELTEELLKKYEADCAKATGDLDKSIAFHKEIIDDLEKQREQKLDIVHKQFLADLRNLPTD
jgi:hypothetical protein